MTTGTPQIKGKFSTATIVKRVDFTHEHFKLWLKTAEPFSFQPGQYCTIGFGGIERPYSIVSSPREPLLELFVEFIAPPVGQLTPLLHKLKVGDTVTMRPRPKGIFVLKPEYRNHVMVSTVTGVAPFVSMIRHWLESPSGSPVFGVLEGASYADEYGYETELNALAAKHPNIRFVATCSRPQDPRNSGWRGETGRVNAVVGKYIEKWGFKAAETCIYACGNPQMIEDVKAQYAGSGFHFEEERFWKDD